MVRERARDGRAGEEVMSTDTDKRSRPTEAHSAKGGRCRTMGGFHGETATRC